MKSFTKNVLVASLLLSSTSVLAFGLNSTTSPGLTSPTGNGTQSSETLSWMSFADTELYFKNDTTGGKAISVTVAYLEKKSSKYYPMSNTFLLSAGQNKTLTLKGDDALVKVFAATLDSGVETPILNLNMCSYNNKYYNPTTGGGKGINRKDITFIAGKTTPEMISYPTTKLKADGYYELNIGDFECWVDPYIIEGSEQPQPQTQPGLENTLS